MLNHYYIPKLPLSEDSSLDYEHISDLKEYYLQNLKMIILTSPGERVMNPSFGVGIKKYLFEPYSQSLALTIDSAIKRQVAEFLPEVIITDNQVSYDGENTLFLKIMYTIPSLNISDSIDIQGSQTTGINFW